MLVIAVGGSVHSIAVGGSVSSIAVGGSVSSIAAGGSVRSNIAVEGSFRSIGDGARCVTKYSS